MPKIDTFSANSLKLLDKNYQEFMEKYVLKISLFQKDERTILGQNYHNLICAYLKGYDISKVLSVLEFDTKELFEKFINSIKDNRQNFIKTEYPFLIKEELDNMSYYLSGRFDAIYKDGEKYIIYDWKTLNFPKDPQDDMQTIVYLYCASVIFSTADLIMRYVSIEKNEFYDVNFAKAFIYKEKIDNTILKYYKS